MVREIRELNKTEATEMINKLSETMNEEFDISKNSIQAFWEIFRRGATMQAPCKQETDPGVAYI